MQHLLKKDAVVLLKRCGRFGQKMPSFWVKDAVVFELIPFNVF
jgi:hypothetical protein